MPDSEYDEDQDMPEIDEAWEILVENFKHIEEIRILMMGAEDEFLWPKELSSLANLKKLEIIRSEDKYPKYEEMALITLVDFGGTGDHFQSFHGFPAHGIRPIRYLKQNSLKEIHMKALNCKALSDKFFIFMKSNIPKLEKFKIHWGFSRFDDKMDFVRCLRNLEMIKDIAEIDNFVVWLEFGKNEENLNDFVELVNETLDINKSKIIILSRKLTLMLIKEKGKSAIVLENPNYSKNLKEEIRLW